MTAHQYPYHRIVKSGQRRQTTPKVRPPAHESECGLSDAGVVLLWELRKTGLGPSKILHALRAAGHMTSISVVRRILDGYSRKHLRPAWAK